MWLGPALDVGPHMTAKILKPNGQMILSAPCCYRLLEDARFLSSPMSVLSSAIEGCKQGLGFENASLEQGGVAAGTWSSIHLNQHPSGQTHNPSEKTIVVNSRGKNFCPRLCFCDYIYRTTFTKIASN